MPMWWPGLLVKCAGVLVSLTSPVEAHRQGATAILRNPVQSIPLSLVFDRKHSSWRCLMEIWPTTPYLGWGCLAALPSVGGKRGLCVISA